MEEVEIKCLCDAIHIKELNLYLRKGQIVYLTKEQAMASKELDRAKRLGAVALRFIRRCRESVTPKFFKKRSRNALEETKRPSTTNIVYPPKKEPFSLEIFQYLENFKENLKDNLLKDMRKAFESNKASGNPQLEVNISSSDKEALASTLESVLRKVMTESGNSGAYSSSYGNPSDSTNGFGGSSSNDPLFIPDKLVNESLDSNIETKKEESSDTSSVDGALDALKALRNKKSSKE